MRFLQAVNTGFFEKYATFSGRASRSEFWWFKLANLAVYYFAMQITNMVALPLSEFVRFNYFSNTIFSHLILRFIIELLILIPFFAAAARRFHDSNISGSVVAPFMLFMIIPYAVILLRMIGHTNPAILTAIINVTMVAQALFYIPLLLRGTNGPNQYGPDPLENNDVAKIFS